MNIETASGLYKLGKLRSEAMPEIAIQALVDGLDSYSLRMLAGESAQSDMSELAPLFEKSLDELGLVLPARVAAIRLVTDHYCDQLLKSDQDPIEWVKLFCNFAYEQECRDDFDPFFYSGTITTRLKPITNADWVTIKARSASCVIRSVRLHVHMFAPVPSNLRV